MNKDLVALSELHFKYLRFVQELTERGVISGENSTAQTDILLSIHDELSSKVRSEWVMQLPF